MPTCVCCRRGVTAKEKESDDRHLRTFKDRDAIAVYVFNDNVLLLVWRAEPSLLATNELAQAEKLVACSS